MCLLSRVSTLQIYSTFGRHLPNPTAGIFLAGLAEFGRGSSLDVMMDSGVYVSFVVYQRLLIQRRGKAHMDLFANVRMG